MIENNSNNMRNWIIFYTDLLIRGLLAFFVIGVGFYIVLVYYFKVKPLYILPVVFIVSVLVSPFLSKIKIGEKIWIGYENWLKKVFNLR